MVYLPDSCSALLTDQDLLRKTVYTTYVMLLKTMIILFPPFKNAMLVQLTNESL